MKARTIILSVFGLIFFVFSCKKESVYQGDHNPDVIKSYRNTDTPVTLKDSLSSINNITRQKLTEIYELSSLYNSNKNDSLMEDILYPQIMGYFLENDTITSAALLSELDSLDVHFIELRSLKLEERDSLVPDSMMYASYNIRYYSKDKKLIDSFKKEAKYILKKEPKKFKNEFVFYFTELNPQIEEEEKDSIPEGVTQ